MSLAEVVLEGNRLALARLLTRIENNTIEGRNELRLLYPYTGKAHLIGITGAPGTGKSSLVNQIALSYRQVSQDFQKKVAIVAVDPSSPFTGGAILGDRVRMRDLSGDPGVFIRSMASRGSLGGLAVATSGIVQVLDAAGYEVILIETVGAGQAEVDIARLAHTTLVVEAPGLGDDIQAIKAGILEIADVLVINKADRPGIESTERALKSMLQLAHPTPRVFQNHKNYTPDNPEKPKGSGDGISPVNIWTPPVLRTIATSGEGIPELMLVIADHYQHLELSGELFERECVRIRSELDLLLRETLMARWRNRVPEDDYHDALEKLVKREMSPWEAVEILIDGDHQ